MIRVARTWRAAALAAAALLVIALGFLGYRKSADRERRALLAEVTRRVAATTLFHVTNEWHELGSIAESASHATGGAALERVGRELAAFIAGQPQVLSVAWLDEHGVERLRRGQAVPGAEDGYTPAAARAARAAARRSGHTTCSRVFESPHGEAGIESVVPVGAGASRGVIVALYSLPGLLRHAADSPELPAGVYARLVDEDGATLAATHAHGVPEAEESVRLAAPFSALTLSAWSEAPLISRGAGALWLLCGLLAASMTVAIVALGEQLSASRAAEAALRESETRFGSVADAAPVMIWMADVDGRCTFLNRPWLTFTGRSLDEELPDRWARGVHPDDLSSCRAAYARAFDARRAFTLEYRLRRADGVYRWVLDSAVARHDVAGDFHGFIGSCIDITERRQAEDALRASEERLRVLVSGLDAIVWEGDAERFHFVSGADQHPLGYSIDEWLAPGFWVNHVHPDDRERAVRECLEATARGSDHALRYRMLAADGRAVWLADRARASDAREGGRLSGLMVDITPMVEMEAALRRAADEWMRTFDALDAALLLLAVDGCVLRLNRSAQALAGRSYRECLGRSLSEVSPDEPWRSAAALVAGFTGPDPSSRQIRDEATAQSWDLSVELMSAHPATPARVILMIRNVTTVVNLQESNRRAKTMAALGAIVAGVAHEVRNPLFAMSVNIDALEVELCDQESLREILDALRHERDRISKLMEDLLEYGRPAPTQLTPGALAPVVSEALARCSLLAERTGVRLVTRAAGAASEAVVRMDATRLQQVFVNLIENACQHAPRGSCVEVAWEIRPASHSPRVICEISDRGRGIPPDVLAQVFEPFVTRRPGGTGLGLSVVQRIVEAHGGGVTAANNPEGGARVIVDLPLA